MGKLWVGERKIETMFQKIGRVVAKWALHCVIIFGLPVIVGVIAYVDLRPEPQPALDGKELWITTEYGEIVEFDPALDGEVSIVCSYREVATDFVIDDNPFSRSLEMNWSGRVEDTKKIEFRNDCVLKLKPELNLEYLHIEAQADTAVWIIPYFFLAISLLWVGARISERIEKRSKSK